MARSKAPYNQFVFKAKNYSVRSTPVYAIVLHTTEGGDSNPKYLTDVLPTLFSNTSNPVSAHAAVDKHGVSARYVPDDLKAFASAAYNSQTLNLEIVGFARYSNKRWRSRKQQLDKIAQYLAYWSDKYEIPLRKGAVKDGKVVRTGVLRHSDLGVRGGNHSDPGPGFPFWYVIRKAKSIQRKARRK